MTATLKTQTTTSLLGAASAVVFNAADAVVFDAADAVVLDAADALVIAVRSAARNGLQVQCGLNVGHEAGTDVHLAPLFEEDEENIDADNTAGHLNSSSEPSARLVEETPSNFAKSPWVWRSMAAEPRGHVHDRRPAYFVLA